MGRRRGRKQPGQTTILLAFLIVFIIGMIGLAVDVGNAFGQQRRIQSVTNAGALAGMGSILAGNTNNVVWTDVQRALAGNRVDTQPQYSYRVDYVTDNEQVQVLGEWNGSIAKVHNGSSLPPKNLARVQITMTEKVPTYFAGVVGKQDLTVNANGVSCLGDYGAGVYPLGVPVSLRPPVLDSKGKVQTPGHQVFFSNGTEMPPTDARFGKWGEGMKQMTIRIPVANGNEFVSGVHISWLNWGGADQTVDGKTYTAISGMKGASALDAAFTAPGTLQQGFLEAASPDPSKPNTKPMRKLQRGDWISGDPGVKASLKDELDAMMQSRTKVMLPFYDVAADTSAGSKVAYHMVNMGQFVVVNHALTGSPKYIDLLYIRDAPTAPEACGSEALAVVDDKRFNIAGEAHVQRVHRTFVAGSTTTYDIVLVMDTSRSMEWDWNDRQPGQSGYDAKNARIHDAKHVITEFVRNFDHSRTTGDPDARIAFVTFGGTAPGKKDYAEGNSTTPSGFEPAIVQAGWSTSGCPAEALITPTLCTDDMKWAPIQSKASSIAPRGLTPGPIAFEKVETLLKDTRTPPAGKKYEQVVVFATDGVFNVCGTSAGKQSCPYGGVVPFDGTSNNILYYLNNPGYNAVSGRPVWQAQQVASRIRASGARIFVVALTPQCLPGSTSCFDPTGLNDMSSGTGFYYQADASSTIASIFATIRQKIVLDTCAPGETTELAPGARVILKRPDNPTWSMQTTADAAGAYVFQNLSAGEYVVRVDPPLSLASSEDNLTRTYSRIRNNLSLTEENQASVYINPQYPNGATEYSSILLSLPLADDGAPHNGCTMP